jgi:O-antigen ligase
VLNRVVGTARHPIEFGVALAGLFPFALHRAIHARGSTAAWLPTVLIGLAIPMSVSRSAVIALGVACLVMFLAWPWTWRRRALVIAPLAVVVVRLIAPGLVGTIISLFKHLLVDPSITGRTDDYSVVFELYAEHILLGRGLFTFVPRYYRILDNQLLMLLIEIGLIGLLAALLFFTVGVFSALTARRRTPGAREKHLAVAIAAGIAGMVSSHLTFDAWSFPMAAGVSFLLVGMAGAARQAARRPPTGRPEALSTAAHEEDR